MTFAPAQKQTRAMQQSSSALWQRRLQRNFVGERGAPAARGWGAREGNRSSSRFRQKPDQDPAIFSV